MGLVPVALPAELVERLQTALDEDPGALSSSSTSRPGASPFPRSASTSRSRSTTSRSTACSRASTTSASPLSHDADITAYEQTRPAWRPSVTP